MPTPAHDHDMFYLHSNCCNAHWELVWRKGKGYTLECEKCGKPVGDLAITGPDLTGQKCSMCESEE